MESLKAIWVPCVFLARPSLSPQGLQAGIFGFSQKGTGPRVQTGKQHRSCQSDSLVRENHCCNILDLGRRAWPSGRALDL